MTAVVDLTQAQIFSAVEQFLLNFSTPPLTSDGLHVIPGNVNDQSLPADGGAPIPRIGTRHRQRP